MDNQEAPQKENAPVADVKSGEPATTSSEKTNVLAIVAIIFAFIFPVVGLVLGLIALSQIKKNKEAGKGLAIASIVLSSLFIVIYLVVLIISWGTLFAIDKAAKDAGVNVDSKNNTVTVSKDGNTAQVGSNVSLPDGFPNSMPIYSGAKIISASKSNGSDYSVMATTSDSTSKVTSYYKSELVAKGWTIDSSTDSSDTYGTGTSLGISNGQLTGTVGVYGDDKKTTTILITVYPKL